MPNPANTPHDPEQMIGHIQAWPELFKIGLNHEISLPESLRSKQTILCCGMGGSAIGAGIIGDFLRDQLTVPYEVLRDYQMPAWVGDQTLVLCLSHSGDTEETLVCYEEARRRGAAILVVTTGGKLLAQAEENGVPAIRFTYDSQPRASVPITLGLLCNTLASLEYAPFPDTGPALARLTELVGDMETPRTVAASLVGKIPIVYGAGFLAEAARRLKGQISENAKQTAAWEVLPELNHNALVGYEFPKQLPDQAVFVLLRSSLESPRYRLRFEVTKELLAQRKLAYTEISGVGEDRLSHLLTVLYLGDAASLQLAYLNGVDPTPVEAIGVLKARLAAS